MQFFLDTASLEQIHHWQSYGLVDGVTTNPALLAKEGGDPIEQLRAVAEVVDGPVSAQVTQTHAVGMISQGRALADLAPNIVVKVPATGPGFQAARTLSKDGIPCNITLTFQPAQAIPFARIGVSYVSLIVGRTEDFGLSSREEIERTRNILNELGSETKLLVASIRNPHHLCDAVTAGADVLTVPPSTWDLVHQNPISLQGLEDFARAWNGLEEDLREPYELLGS